jgi:hypothetical protein
MSCRHKQNANFNFQLPAMFVVWVLHKNSLIKSCSSSEDLSAYKMSWSYIYWCKFLIHLISMNVRHFGLVKATGLNVMALRSPSTTFYKTLQTGSEANRGTDRNTG